MSRMLLSVALGMLIGLGAIGLVEAGRCPVLNVGNGLTVDLNQVSATVLEIDQIFEGAVNKYQWGIDFCTGNAPSPSGAAPCASPSYVGEYNVHNPYCVNHFGSVASQWNWNGTAAVSSFVNNQGWTIHIAVLCGTSGSLHSNGPVIAKKQTDGTLISFSMTLSTYFACPSSGPAPTPNPSPSLLWSTQTPPTSQYGDPAIDNEYLFVGSQDPTGVNNTVFALNRFSGALLWHKTEVGQGLYVAVGKGLVFTGTFGFLIARNQSTGTEVWRFRVPADKIRPDLQQWPGKPTYRDGVVYCTWYATPLFAFDAVTGSVKYSTTFTVGSRIFSPLEHNHLYFMSVDDAGVYAVSAAKIKDGSMVWSTSFGPAYASLVANDYGIATLSFPPNTTNVSVLSGFDMNTGENLWSIASTEPTADTNFDYNLALNHACGTYQNTTTHYTIFCVDAKTGVQLWSAAMETQDSSINLAAFGRTLYVIALVDGKTWAFDSVNGNRLWRLDQPDPYYGIEADDVYYFGANNTEIMAVKVRGA